MRFFPSKFTNPRLQFTTPDGSGISLSVSAVFCWVPYNQVQQAERGKMPLTTICLGYIFHFLIFSL